MNRITIQKGYDLPFSGFGAAPKRRSSRKSAAFTRQQGKMKACARDWKRHGRGSYKAHMKRCLSK